MGGREGAEAGGRTCVILQEQQHCVGIVHRIGGECARRHLLGHFEFGGLEPAVLVTELGAIDVVGRRIAAIGGAAELRARLLRSHRLRCTLDVLQTPRQAHFSTFATNPVHKNTRN